MNQMSRDKDQELFQEMTIHLLKDDKPSDYMNQLSQSESFTQYPFLLLMKLKKTEQSAKYHPEGNVWNHTMLVLDEAAKFREQSKNEKVFMWAALLHDIGKPDTTRERKGKITSYDHDRAGEKLCKDFLCALTEAEQFIKEVADLVRYHMHMLYVLKNLPYADTKRMLHEVDMNDIALLCLCDRLGRAGADVEYENSQYQEFIRQLERLMVKQNS